VLTINVNYIIEQGTILNRSVSTIDANYIIEQVGAWIEFGAKESRTNFFVGTTVFIYISKTNTT
jgi:hypothetical protein